MLSAWPALRGLAETMRAYEAGLLACDIPRSAPRDLAALLAAGGADVRRAGHVASGGTAGDPRFDLMVDHVLALLRGAHGLRCPGEVAATIEALGEWRHRSDAALLAMTRFAEGRRPPVRGFFAFTP